MRGGESETMKTGVCFHTYTGVNSKFRQSLFMLSENILYHIRKNDVLYTFDYHLLSGNSENKISIVGFPNFTLKKCQTPILVRLCGSQIGGAHKTGVYKRIIYNHMFYVEKKKTRK